MQKKILTGIVFTLLVFSRLVAPLAAEEKLVSYQAMNLELALKLAQDTLLACQNEGYQVSVVVVDRSGIVQVLLRDRLAGIFTPDIAVRKARTALNFHTDTINLREPTESGEEGSGIRHFPGALMVAGGVRIEAAGNIVGSLGVSGAPGPINDDVCARTGLEESSDILNF
jgi:uncharacterized protein GlcG (DUF336 family)